MHKSMDAVIGIVLHQSAGGLIFLHLQKCTSSGQLRSDHTRGYMARMGHGIGGFLPMNPGVKLIGKRVIAFG